MNKKNLIIIAGLAFSGNVVAQVRIPVNLIANSGLS